MTEKLLQCEEIMQAFQDNAALNISPGNQPVDVAVHSPVYQKYNCSMKDDEVMSKEKVITDNINGAHNGRPSFFDCKSQDKDSICRSKSNSRNSVRKRNDLSPLSDKENKKFCQLEPKVSTNLEDNSRLQPDNLKDSNAVKQENDISPSDFNDIYKGLLSEGIKTFPKPEVTRQKLKRMKRKDLENLILEQMVATLLEDCKLGYQKDLCMRLEHNLEYAHKKISQLSREIKELKRVTRKLGEEHAERRQELVYPSIIKRSVSIQVEPCYIDQDYDDDLSDEDVEFMLPESPVRKKHKNRVNSKFKSKQKRKVDDEYENCSDMDDRSCYESLIDDSDTDEREEVYKKKISQYNNTYKNGTKIPRPTLSAKQKKKSIILTWNTPLSSCQNIASFRLFSCQNDKLKSKKRWKIIGDVEPMELPMACTLTDFHPSKTYHFAVKAINFKGESGPMSKCDTVLMS